MIYRHLCLRFAFLLRFRTSWVYSPVLRLIVQLSQTRSLRPAAMVTLHQLWLLQPRVFPELQDMVDNPLLKTEAFSTGHSFKLSGARDLELHIAHAHTVYVFARAR